MKFYKELYIVGIIIGILTLGIILMVSTWIGFDIASSPLFIVCWITCFIPCIFFLFLGAYAEGKYTKRIEKSLEGLRSYLMQIFERFIYDVDSKEILGTLLLFVETLHESFRVEERHDIEEAKRLFNDLINQV